MAKIGRRYKLYAAEAGTTYQYFFAGRRALIRPEGQGAGSDYNFVVSADQRPPFLLKVFVSERALAAWRATHGRDLDANEQYALAKMGLYHAFDTYERLVAARLSLVVDETNVEALLEPLELA